MHADNIVQIPGGVAKLVVRQDLQQSDAWHKAFESHCKDYRYYEILDQTLRDGFEHFYLVLEDADRCIRAIQPLFFLRQNLTEGVTGRIRSIINSVRQKFP